MAKILRITQDYVILYKTIPENEGVLSKDIVYPLMKGDLMEWVDTPIEFPKSLLWVSVKTHLTRVNESVGFVKAMYLEQCTIFDDSELPEVVITTKPIMDKVRIDKIIRLIKENIKHKHGFKKFHVLDVLIDFLDLKYQCLCHRHYHLMPLPIQM